MRVSVPLPERHRCHLPFAPGRTLAPWAAMPCLLSLTWTLPSTLHDSARASRLVWHLPPWSRAELVSLHPCRQPRSCPPCHTVLHIDCWLPRLPLPQTVSSEEEGWCWPFPICGGRLRAQLVLESVGTRECI